MNISHSTPVFRRTLKTRLQILKEDSAKRGGRVIFLLQTYEAKDQRQIFVP